MEALFFHFFSFLVFILPKMCTVIDHGTFWALPIYSSFVFCLIMAFSGPYLYIYFLYIIFSSYSYFQHKKHLKERLVKLSDWFFYCKGSQFYRVLSLICLFTFLSSFMSLCHKSLWRPLARPAFPLLTFYYWNAYPFY